MCPPHKINVTLFCLLLFGSNPQTDIFLLAIYEQNDKMTERNGDDSISQLLLNFRQPHWKAEWFLEGIVPTTIATEGGLNLWSVFIIDHTIEKNGTREDVSNSNRKDIFI